MELSNSKHALVDDENNFLNITYTPDIQPPHAHFAGRGHQKILKRPLQFIGPRLRTQARPRSHAVIIIQTAAVQAAETLYALRRFFFTRFTYGALYQKYDQIFDADKRHIYHKTGKAKPERFYAAEFDNLKEKAEQQSQAGHDYEVVREICKKVQTFLNGKGNIIK